MYGVGEARMVVRVDFNRVRADGRIFTVGDDVTYYEGDPLWLDDGEGTILEGQVWAVLPNNGLIVERT